MKKVISFDKEILFPTMIGEITAISLDQTLKFLTKNDIEGDFIVSGRYKMTEASAIEEEFKYTLPIEITLAETFTLDTTKIEIHDFYYEIIDEEILKVKIDIQIEGVEEILLAEEEIEEVLEKEIEKLEDGKSEKVEQMGKETRAVIEEVKEDTVDVILEENREDRECDGKEKDSEEKLTDIEPVLSKSEEIVDIMKQEVEKKEESFLEVIETENSNENTIDTKDKKENNANIQSIFRVFNDAEETYKAYTVYIMRKNDSINTVLDRYQITKEQLEEYNDLTKIELGSKVIIPTIHD